MRGTEAGVCLELLRAGLAASPIASGDFDELESLNWASVLGTARQHRLGGLFCEGVRRLSWERRVPAPAWESLQMSYYSNLAHNLVLFRHGEQIVERTARLGLPVILLKGAALAGSLYGNVALRPMADLDLLVRREEGPAMEELARELGYERQESADHATLLRHRGSGTYLEVHTGLLSCPDYFALRTEDLLARSRPAAFWPAPARTLSPADHLLHLSLHGSFQHAFHQAAINACDMFLLSRSPNLDWDAFFATARAPRLAPLVYGGLVLAHRLLPSENLRQALETLRPRASWLQKRAVEGLSAESLLAPLAEDAPVPAWRRILWAPGLSDALSLVRHTLNGPGGKQSAWAGLKRALALVSRHAPAVLRSRKARGALGKSRQRVKPPSLDSVAPAAVGTERFERASACDSRFPRSLN
jgi:hypothetical protein